MAFFEKDSTEQIVECQHLQAGTILFNRFEVIEPLGRGGFASVYRCQDRGGIGQVAIKVFPAQVARDKLTAGRIHREIRAAHAIDDQNVARFFECIRDEHLIAIVMECVEGQTLAEICTYEHGRDYREVCDTLIQIIRGVRAIHAVDVVHRDLKPANILRTADGTIKITDFGLARGVGDRRASGEFHNLGALMQLDPDLTSGSSVVGTPLYLSPEYVKMGFLDQRSDLYSFGVIAYQLLAGQAPWTGATIAQLFLNKVENDPPNLGLLLPDCPSELAALIMLCLRRDPDERPQSAQEVLHNLTVICNNIKSESLSRIVGVPRQEWQAQSVKTKQRQMVFKVFKMLDKALLLPYRIVLSNKLASVLVLTLLFSMILCALIYSMLTGKLKIGTRMPPPVKIEIHGTHTPSNSKTKVIKSVEDARALKSESAP